MATTPTAPASLEDVTRHPLCQVIYSAERIDSPYRFHFSNGVCDDFAADYDVLQMAAMFISDGLPFTFTVSEYIP